MTDIEIAQGTSMKNIIDVVKDINLSKEDLTLYGNYKAKITKNINEDHNGKLILVTATNPTPYGEGKTTVSIGLGDALNKLNKKTITTLRQPSMGPVFGLKGGATGGGLSQVLPMEDINLHFTGDFHAITSANNLLCAAIDNHIYHGNELDIKEVLFHRCLDVNDRELRNIKLNNRSESFSITAASEVMAIFCLAKDFDDLKLRLGKIIIGTNSKGDYIYAKDLKIEGSMAVLLRDAFYPNVVQSLEHNPVFVHGGPFANIAHGCCSVRSTKLALSLADYVVTEAGFGADLGAEKFFDIKCRTGNIKPDCIVLVTTVRALKYHGNDNIKDGIPNLIGHIKNLKLNNSNIIVCINKFSDDSLEDIKYIIDSCKKVETKAIVSTAYSDGSDGAIDLANEVVKLLSNDNKFSYLYSTEESLTDKIEKIATKIYHANSIQYSSIAQEKMKELEVKKMHYMPICVAKTQYSFSDDKLKLGYPTNFSIYVRDIELKNGAGFINIYLGKILTMPGLSKHPNYENIGLDKNLNIKGIF